MVTNKFKFPGGLFPLSIGSIIISSGLMGNSCTEASKDYNNASPNVLIIAIDDMKDWVGYLGGYGGEVHTPNIDRLASQGVGFTNAHVASPQSCPSRNAFFTGKRPSTTGLYGNNVWWKAAYPDMVTLPQYFKNHGYYTAGAGKVFHHTPGNNPPVSWNEFQDQVFDDLWNFATWSPERYWLDYGYRDPITPLPSWKPLHGIHELSTPMDWGPIPAKHEEDYGDVQVANYGRDFLKREHTRPFFLALGIYRPHIPWHVPQEYFDLYPLDEIVLPEVPDNELDDVPEEGRRLATRRRDFQIIKDAGKWEEAVQGYLASISFADALVGDILDALESSDYYDNTIIVLWSDHGFHLGSKQTWHKWTLWEQVTRIPFIIKAPGITEGGVLCHQPVDMLNVYPTLISLCDLPPKNDLEGYDMSRLLYNPDSEWEWPAITEYQPGQVAVRSMNWRYIRYSDGSEELYDRIQDPGEWLNLASDKKYAEELERHRKWVPYIFAEPASNRNNWFFDPCAYIYMHRETGEFIDGKK